MNSTELPDFGEDVDLTLRHVSRQFPTSFAKALLPNRKEITGATWLDTQVTSRQRRLDRVIEVQAGEERRLEHVEWQLEWEASVPERLFEYHVLVAMTVMDKSNVAHVRPPIRTTVVLLSGREKPWPSSGECRTSPPGELFSGVSFEIDAVYQKTVAELCARASPFWLIFTPLAVDADAANMKLAVNELRARARDRELEELLAAMLVMADVDKRNRNLREVILPLLREETVMQNWLYKQGEARGREAGKALGEAHGREIGKAVGEATALLRILERRGTAVPAEAREKILACTNTSQLETWLDRALTATVIDEVLTES
ncbi:MAG: hypothetical protein IPK82_26560 [Polyangiaceae bacterium]|nr:hypothetical protein [Polyangiaceae bacterium]